MAYQGERWGFGGMNRKHGGGESRTSPLDSPDDDPTPPWAARAGMEFIVDRIYDGDPAPLKTMSVLEPCANRGYFAEAIRPWFKEVRTGDILDYGYPLTEGLWNFADNPPQKRYDWVITNPPFNRAIDFVRNALSVADKGAAIFIRFTWGAKHERGKLFRSHPVRYYAAYEDRVNTWHGKISRETKSPVESAWVVWTHPLSEGSAEPPLSRIVKGKRKQWERKGDYPDEQVPTPQWGLF